MEKIYKRTQRTPHSFIKNGKESKNVAFFWKEWMPNPVQFILFFKLSNCKIASMAKNWINSVPQTATTTFAFSSIFIVLLWLTIWYLWYTIFYFIFRVEISTPHKGKVSRDFNERVPDVPLEVNFFSYFRFQIVF